jgi:hypothetical protein
MHPSPQVFENVTENLQEALRSTEDSTARFHIRSAAQRLVIIEEALGEQTVGPTLRAESDSETNV